MRILVHSNAPWEPTAYGQQTAITVPLLEGLGHEVIISAYHGLQGGPIRWHGLKVIPGGAEGDPYGARLIAEHVRHEGIDLVITLMDIWVLDAVVLRDLPALVAHWIPVDCAPLSAKDEAHLKVSGAVPVAMSRFGQEQLAAAGLDALYVPHALHPAYAEEPPDREAARAALGIGDLFAIGMCAGNKDAFRKGYYEQFAAFAGLYRDHPDTVLLVHALAAPGETGLDLAGMAQRLGIAGAVRFVDQYGYLSGRIPVAHLRDWYAALDLLSACSMGEGFGIPVIEAQACGTPVIVTRASAMPELAPEGSRVGGEPFWNPFHQAAWVKPDIGQIALAYEEAYHQRGADRRPAAIRESALRFEAGRVLSEHWQPALEVLESIARQRLPAGAVTDPAEAAAALWSGWGRHELGWDIGASKGQSLAQMHDLCARVVALEPASESYAELEAAWKSGDAAEWLTVVQVAVSDSDGQLTTAVREQSIAAGQLTAAGMAGEGLRWGELAGTRDVQCLTVDTLAGKYGTPEFIKVDTEGHEARILAGAAGLLAAGQARWLIEFHSAGLHAQCSRVLAAAGYAVETVRHPHYPPGSRLWHDHGWIRATPIPQEQA